MSDLLPSFMWYRIQQNLSEKIRTIETFKREQMFEAQIKKIWTAQKGLGPNKIHIKAGFGQHPALQLELRL